MGSIRFQLDALLLHKSSGSAFGRFETDIRIGVPMETSLKTTGWFGFLEQVTTSLLRMRKRSQKAVAPKPCGTISKRRAPERTRNTSPARVLHCGAPKLTLQLLPSSSRTLSFGQVLGTCPSQDHVCGQNKNLQIQPKAPIRHVFRVESNVCFERRILPCLDLPEAG
jgi:hypothetical protein